jgi:hypothetical protein
MSCQRMTARGICKPKSISGKDLLKIKKGLSLKIRTTHIDLYSLSGLRFLGFGIQNLDRHGFQLGNQIADHIKTALPEFSLGDIDAGIA